MAHIRLEPPGVFDFKRPDEWPRWKCRFEQYRCASGLDKEAEPRQVSALLYCMGKSAEDVLTSTGISDGDREKYTSVMNALETFFKVRRNVILERAKFNRRNQMAGESAEQYITELYHLVETCDYNADIVEEMLRDRLVVGMRDSVLAERLQLNPELTLEKAKKAMRHKEAVKEQNLQLKGDSVDAVKVDRSSSEGRRRKTRYPKSSPSGAVATAKPKCTRCGRPPHPAGARCPASTTVCNRCNRKGHYQSQCYSKTKAAVADTSELTTEAFLGSVEDDQNPIWQVSALIGDQSVFFKLDTGAQVTAVTEETYRAISPGPLKKPSRVLYWPTRQTIETIGKFSAKVTVGDRMSKQTIYVVRGLQRNLLGLPAITSFNLAHQIGETITVPDVRNWFRKVFSGLGSLGEPYLIKLKEDAVPYTLFTPRNVAIPLREQVRNELERMESLKVVSKVTQPTDWCAVMVVVPKRSREVRICVDLKPLNECVLREVYPIPKVDETLAQLSGASVFSKLDANSGFWQIRLAEESKHLTTFITPFGRYWFNKLPFGISSAPELFQRRMGQILEGLPGVLCLMDDVIITGKDQTEHNERLQATLERLEAAGVTLNPQKCEFGKRTKRFLGHVVSGEGIRPDPEKTSSIRAMPPPTCVSDLRRFLGMVNRMGKFSPNIADLSKPLRELLGTK